MGKITTIYLDEDLHQIIQEKQEEGFNFSSWINEQIRTHFTDIDFLQLKKEKLTTQIQKINEEIKLLQKYEKPKRTEQISEQQKKFIKETIKILEKDTTYFNGRYTLYKNTFLKPITKTEFIRLIEKEKNEKTQTN